MYRSSFSFCLIVFIIFSVSVGVSQSVAQSPAPVGTFTLELDPPENWKSWRPARNSVLTFTANVGGDTMQISSVTEYVFTLKDVSDYTGFCMNAGSQSGDQKDIYFRQSDQPATDEDSLFTYTVSGSNSETLKISCKGSPLSVSFSVFVDDYGAHGILDGVVSLNDRKDEEGREVDNTPSNNAAPSYSLSIPLDNNGNDIADGWKDDAKVFGGKGYNPWDDDESGPDGNKKNGDGFTVFEEYRGFLVKGEHKDTEPLTDKDLFVYSDFTEGYGYASNLPSVFKLRLIDAGNMASNTRRMNRYTCGAGKRYKPVSGVSRSPQSAVHVENASASKRQEVRDSHRGLNGVVTPAVAVPYLVQYCRVYQHRIERGIKWIDEHPNLQNYYRDYYTKKLQGTIGHEIGHCMELYDVRYDRHEKHFGVGIWHGHTIMQHKEISVKWDDGTELTEDERREDYAEIVRRLDQNGYPYPAKVHKAEYNLISSHRGLNRPANPLRKIKPQWTDSTDSTDSADNTATIPTVPGSPVIRMVLIRGETQVLVMWRPVSENGGSEITDYEYRYQLATATTEGDWASAGVSSSNKLVSNLTPGASYTVEMRAKNSVGYSDPSSAFPFTMPTAPTIPGVPTDVTTTVSNGMVTLSWTAPTDDGGGIDKYQYRVDKNIDGTWGDWIDVPSDGTSLPLSVSVSVENGVDYAFQVLSNNSAGSSTGSVTSSALPVDPYVSPPTVVGMLSATPSDGQVRLSWDEPGTGTPVIAYEYTYDESNDGSWSSWKRTKSTGTSHDVTGLTNDTIYAFKVRARNTGGIGTETSKVTATPFAYTVPGKIRDLTASLTSDNKVRLDWKAPLDDGGSPITHYDYRKDTYNDGTWTIWYSTGDSSTDEIFYSVIPGVTYAFRIRAANTAGPGSPSDSVVIRVPTVPSVPLTLSASITSNKRVSLDWSAPADDGGSPITRYDYYIYADDGHGEQWLPTGEGTLTQKSWPGAGFSAGLTYTFKVRAVNAIGIGTATEGVTLTIPANTTPSAPLLLTASEGNASVYLSWNEPADDGYVVVRGGLLKYQYRYRQSGGTWNSWSSEQWDRYATQSNLTNGTTYEFEVHAVNDVGTGTAASVSATPTGTAAPGVPQYFDTDGDNGSVDLWWEPPEYDGGSSITDYEYRYKESTQSNWNGWTSAGNADEEYPEFTVTGLTNGTSYDFQVRARNAVGPGAHTETLTETPTAQTPETPTGVSASAGTAAGTIDLTWTAPDDGGSAITNYKVIHGIFQNNRWTWTRTAISTGSTNTSYTVTGLQSGGLYRFRVRAVNSVGESSYSRVAQSRAP